MGYSSRQARKARQAHNLIDLLCVLGVLCARYSEFQSRKERSMASYETSLSRRRFLQHTTTLGVSALIAPALAHNAFAASKDRAVIYQGVSLDSLHPYGYSGGGINGIWLHVIEPLIVMDYTATICRRAGRLVGVSGAQDGFFSLGATCAVSTTARRSPPRTWRTPSTNCKTTSAACRAPTCKARGRNTRRLHRRASTPRQPTALLLTGWRLGYISAPPRNTATI